MDQDNQSTNNIPRHLKGKRKGKFCKRKKQPAQRLGSKKNDLPPEKNSILKGLEIVSLSFLSKKLCCTNCNIYLSINSATSKVQDGFDHIYTFKCSSCQSTKTVHTNPPCKDNPQLSSVNVDAARSMIESGLEVAQLNVLLSEMDIPTLPDDFLEQYREHIKTYKVEAQASESCSKSLEQEQSWDDAEIFSWSVNVNAARGMIKSGLTEAQVNAFFKAIRIAAVPDDFVKRYKQHFGIA